MVALSRFEVCRDSFYRRPNGRHSTRQLVAGIAGTAGAGRGTLAEAAAEYLASAHRTGNRCCFGDACQAVRTRAPCRERRILLSDASNSLRFAPKIRWLPVSTFANTSKRRTRELRREPVRRVSPGRHLGWPDSKRRETAALLWVPIAAQTGVPSHTSRHGYAFGQQRSPACPVLANAN
jgi:hypothetical protein